MHKKIRILTDCTLEDFASKLSEEFGDTLNNYETLEMDISKYDKSQDEVALEWDLKVMEIFGVNC